MRLIFLGSPAFAVPSLRALISTRHEIVAVVTQPDRPAGRGRAPTAPPVKLVALEQGLTVLQPENVSAPESVERLRTLEPDVMIVAAYGQILRQRLLDVPSRGSLNVHASLLPRHRGAAPIAAAILAGDEKTGVTIMEVVRALDAGPMVARVEETISPLDTTGSLETRLSEKGARLLAETLDPWAERRIQATPQDDRLSTYAPMIKREDALIDWSRSAVEIWRSVRAYNPWPVAYTVFAGTELRIWEAWPIEGDAGKEPGMVLPAERLSLPIETIETICAETGRGRLALITLQRPGKKALPGIDFLRGQRDLIGKVLGQ